LMSVRIGWGRKGGGRVSGQAKFGPERALLESMLEVNRDALITAVAGLSDSEARQQRVPSLTTPLALVKHCAVAERIWFQRTLDGIPFDQCDGYAVAGDDSSWRTTESDTIAGAVAEYQRARKRSIDIALRYPLDYVTHHPRLGDVSLRWIYLHMIAELARHAGHADILAEQIRAVARQG
jgi:uncharacterized damage-inducible protein DinB